MKTLGEFIRKRRRELGLFGREVVAAVRKADGTPISIPYLVDLEQRSPQAFGLGTEPVGHGFADRCRPPLFPRRAACA